MSHRIWNKDLSVDRLNDLCEGTIHTCVGIRYTEIGDDFLAAEMPVDSRTKQPFGFLHGGASVVLAESLGSMASYLVLNAEEGGAMGIEVNANHIKAVREGLVLGRATPVHLGRTLHVWEIKISDSGGALVSISRLTVMVRKTRS